MNENLNIDILLVEDNPTDAEMALRALRENKISNDIFLVEDGEEALDFIFSRGKYEHRKDNSHPKLVLLDLKLPKVDGLEVLRVIKQDSDRRMMPVVVLTSSSEDRDIIECYRLGVNSYIVKPVDFDKFTQAIRDLGLYWLVLNKTQEM